MGQSLRVAMSENKEKCAQKSLYFMILPNPFTQEPIISLLCYSRWRTVQIVRTLLWVRRVLEAADTWAEGRKKHLNCHIPAHGWLHLERQNTLLPLSGCQKEGSCLSLCSPQPADHVSYHFLKLTCWWRVSSQCFLPKSFSWQMTGIMEVFVNYDSREKSEHSQFICLHLAL